MSYIETYIHREINHICIANNASCHRHSAIHEADVTSGEHCAPAQLAALRRADIALFVLDEIVYCFVYVVIIVFIIHSINISLNKTE